MILVKIKSSPPTKSPTIREIITTTMVKRTTSGLEGQVTLVSSLLTSLKNLAGFVCGIKDILTKYYKGFNQYLAKRAKGYG
jgi:hypothetical protein